MTDKAFIKALEKMAKELNIQGSQVSLHASQKQISAIDELKNAIQWGKTELIQPLIEKCPHDQIKGQGIDQLMQAYIEHYGPEWQTLCDKMKQQYPHIITPSTNVKPKR